jgi:L-lactate dehydrogenase complex protein LldG
MPTSRDQILRDIRTHLPVEAPLPGDEFSAVRYDDPRRQFLETLEGVGGAGLQVGGLEELQIEVQRLATVLHAASIGSALPEVFGGNVDLAVDDPHELANVDLAILPGELAVAENAAVWVTDAIVPQRVAYFLSQHVALVVPQDRIVNNMHEAYVWLHAAASGEKPFSNPQWGTFMSGPSKTADIEQALVIGAHGARSLHVFFTP